ncbi:Avidin/streptavidin [Cylindrobasidium torrendii FP15055 ss-10]|uniref:Avidin/streptavidin n=1 Tax=Cylindrobasidium torrendii FP15055 ss-10 TaxID=1314674 RepID=A0A0D7B4C0_9AGAR|nr:Avidin/streptavidin [Cylindrobasidium torrendii FP15055 ss-10]
MHVLSAATLATAIGASINGTWYNELGSYVELEASPDGTLSGRYNSAVGQATHEYVLTGRYDTRSHRFDGATLGWTVNWENDRKYSPSTTVWSGQYFSGNKGESIRTQWLLTSSTWERSAWQSTLIGADIFTREKVVGVAGPDEMD